MTSQRSILIIGGTGHIGQELAPLLLKETSTKLIFTTRNADALRKTIPTSATNAQIEQGNVTDPLWVESIIRKHAVDTVFLAITVNGDELITTLNTFDAMHRAGGIKQLIYISVCGNFADPAGLEALSRANSAGHIAAKIPIELKLKYADFGWSTTVLGPSMFFTNDERSKRGMLEDGIFDEPHGLGFSRVSMYDIALAARNIMFSPPEKYAGRKIQIGSLHRYTGEEVAALWSKALGKEIKAWGSDVQSMQQFEDARAKLWGAGFARDIRLMYEAFQVWAFAMSEEEYRVQTEVLGKEAEGYEEWVMEVGKVWKQ